MKYVHLWHYLAWCISLPSFCMFKVESNLPWSNRTTPTQVSAVCCMKSWQKTFRKIPGSWTPLADVWPAALFFFAYFVWLVLPFSKVRISDSVTPPGIHVDGGLLVDAAKIFFSPERTHRCEIDCVAFRLGILIWEIRGQIYNHKLLGGIWSQVIRR